MSALRPGEVVDITIRGVRVTGDQGPRGTTTIADEHGDHYVMPPQAAIERVEPEFWPPIGGDLWRDAFGELWFCRVDPSPYLIASSDRYHGAAPHVLLDGRGPLTLVHREPPF